MIRPETREALEFQKKKKKNHSREKLNLRTRETEILAMTVMNFTPLMSSCMIRVNNCACIFNCFPFQTSRPSTTSSSSHPPAACLGCFSKWHPGLWPWSLGCDHWRTSGEGLSGPRHHVTAPSAAAAARISVPAPQPRGATRGGPSPAAGGRRARRPGCVRAGPGALRASPAPSGAGHCGWLPRPGERRLRRPPGPAPDPRGCHIWKGFAGGARDTRAQLSGCLRGCLDDFGFLCDPVTWTWQSSAVGLGMIVSPCPGRMGTLACFEGKAGQEAEKGRRERRGGQVGLFSPSSRLILTHICVLLAHVCFYIRLFMRQKVQPS